MLTTSRTLLASLCLGTAVLVGGCTVPEETTTPTSVDQPAVTSPGKPTAPQEDTPSSTGGTASQENARKMAESYLDTMPHSRSGLIDQLEYEGFSTADATFGVDAANADWNEQAAKMAASYQETMPHSRSGLVEQLVFEGFTQEQAEYGVGTTGL